MVEVWFKECRCSALGFRFVQRESTLRKVVVCSECVEAPIVEDWFKVYISSKVQGVHRVLVRF